MPSPAETRMRLAAQQAALVSALTAGAPAPQEFDVPRVLAAGAALRRKRMRALAHAWPALAQALGGRFHDRFNAYAAEHALPQVGGALADGRQFAAWLADWDDMPDECRLLQIRFDLRFSATNDKLTPRRWPKFSAVFLRRRCRLVVAVRLPYLGEYCMSIPFCAFTALCRLPASPDTCQRKPT